MSNKITVFFSSPYFKRALISGGVTFLIWVIIMPIVDNWVGVKMIPYKKGEE